jgi:cyclopropane fatty-acyl-phospholipid synthase-like methyltransferase
MEWKDEASQHLRFSILTDVCDLNGKSVHEVGAGAGHFCDYLAKKGIDAEYSGSDVSPAMVEAAERLHPDIRFEQRDIVLEPPDETYDVVVSSGVFNVRLSGTDAEWSSFVREAIRRMFQMSRLAIAFNVMSDFVDYRNDLLYYANAGQLLDFCRRELSRFVVLRHDYPLYEYTLYVYRHPHS